MHTLIHNRLYAQLAVLAMIIAVLVGCKSFQLKIATAPEGGKIVVRDPNAGNKEVQPLSGTRDRYKLEFPSATRTYSVEATLSGFESVTTSINRDAAEGLPADPNSSSGKLWQVVMRKRIHVTIYDEPEDARATIKDSSGRTIGGGQGAIHTELTFWQGGPSYTVSASRDEYVASQITIDWNAAENARSLAGGNKYFQLQLQGRLFVDQPQAVIDYDPQRGFVGIVRTVRAYRVDTEPSGLTPSRIHELGTGLGIRGLALSPDGTRITFAEATPEDMAKLLTGARTDAVPVKSCQIKAINIGEQGVIQLTQPGYVDIDPAYTADEGRSIMFASNRYGQPSVLQIRADQPGGIQTVFRDERDPGWAASRPSMGADGSIVFTLLPPAGTRDVGPEIWTTGGPNRFNTFVVNGEEAQVSPDGARIAYIGKDSNLWVVNRDGTNRTQLTTKSETLKSDLLSSLSARDRAFYQRYPHLLRPYALPTWTPDSQRIMFVSMEGLDSTGRPNADIWMVNTDGTGARQLTANGSVDTYPVMSPDLQRIYFVSNRGNRWAIFVMPVPAG